MYVQQKEDEFNNYIQNSEIQENIDEYNVYIFIFSFQWIENITFLDYL